jgi:hypothetical protein
MSYLTVSAVPQNTYSLYKGDRPEKRFYEVVLTHQANLCPKLGIDESIYGYRVPAHCSSR